MRTAFLLACVLSIAALALLAARPDLDLSVAAWFHGTDGFIGQGQGAKFWRAFFNVTPFVVAASYLLLYAAKRFGPFTQPTRYWGSRALKILEAVAADASRSSLKCGVARSAMRLGRAQISALS